MSDAEPRVPDALLDFDENLVVSSDGEPFTGVGFDEVPGRGLSEISYQGGMQEGPARDWYPNGRLKVESYYRENVLHGVTKEFNEQGVLVRRAVYEYGILVVDPHIGTDGNMVESHHPAEGSPNHRLLERFRREIGWPAPS